MIINDTYVVDIGHIRNVRTCNKECEDVYENPDDLTQ